MKPEARLKAQASRQSSQAERDKQTIRISDKWKITRPDEYNWCIVRQGFEKEPWFYGRLLHALQALPHKILDEGQKKSLADISKQMDEIQATIEKLRFYTFEKLNDDI